MTDFQFWMLLSMLFIVRHIPAIPSIVMALAWWCLAVASKIWGF